MLCMACMPHCVWLVCLICLPWLVCLVRLLCLVCIVCIVWLVCLVCIGMLCMACMCLMTRMTCIPCIVLWIWHPFQLDCLHEDAHPVTVIAVLLIIYAVCLNVQTVVSIEVISWCNINYLIKLMICKLKLGHHLERKNVTS